MTLEEALIDLGDEPLSKSPFSKTIRAFVNATLGGDTPITLDMPGSTVLSQVYQCPDQVKQDRMLNKSLGAVRGKDSYQTAILVLAVPLVVVFVLIALAEVFNDTPLSHNYFDLLMEMIKGTFGLIGQLIEGWNNAQNNGNT
jgi:hypothetical protein